VERRAVQVRGRRLLGLRLRLKRGGLVQREWKKKPETGSATYGAVRRYLVSVKLHVPFVAADYRTQLSR